MKFYSEVTKQLYDTADALTKAEAAAEKAKAAEEEKKKARAARAKEVEDAYKAILDAQQKYVELKNKFIEDYGSFHISLTQKTPVGSKSDFSSLIDALFNL